MYVCDIHICVCVMCYMYPYKRVHVADLCMLDAFGTLKYIHTYIHAYIHTYTHTYIHPSIHTYIHAQGTSACGCAGDGCANSTMLSDTDMAVRLAACASLDMCYSGQIKMAGCVHMQVCMCYCVYVLLCVCVCGYLCAFVREWSCVYVYSYVYVYVYIHLFLSFCMYLCI